jgi:hypothetical protein
MVLFSDGQAGSTQETAHDYSAWTSTGQSGAVLSVSTDVAHHGSYAFKGTGLTALSRYVFAEKTFTANNTVFARAYIRFTADFTANTTETALLRFSQNGTEYYNLNLQRQLDGTYRWNIASQVGGLSYFSAAFTLLLNAWYCCELQVTTSATVGVLQAYVDGLSVINQTGLNLGATKLTSVRIEAYNSPSNTNAGTIYWDCVVVDTAYIGVESSGIQRFLLINEGY